MAKKILHDTHAEPLGYILIGISCHLKDYRLSFLLNKRLEFGFTKQQDLTIALTDRKEPADFSFYYYKDEDQGNSYWLLANRNEEYVLLPELKQLDFLLIVEGECKKNRKDSLIKVVSSIQNVLTAYEISLQGIRNFGNLLAEMEIHLKNIFRKPKTHLKPN